MTPTALARLRGELLNLENDPEQNLVKWRRRVEAILPDLESAASRQTPEDDDAPVDDRACESCGQSLADILGHWTSDDVLLCGDCYSALIESAAALPAVEGPPDAAHVECGPRNHWFDDDSHVCRCGAHCRCRCSLTDGRALVVEGHPAEPPAWLVEVVGACSFASGYLQTPEPGIAARLDRAAQGAVKAHELAARVLPVEPAK